VLITLIYSKELYGEFYVKAFVAALKMKDKLQKPLQNIDQEKFDGIMFFCPSAVESYLTNNKSKKLFSRRNTTKPH
jgi:uroporphyrinogen-III synthase